MIDQIVDTRTASQVDEATVLAFEEALRGELLRPGTVGYDEARTVWNAMVDRRPTLIARCAGASDVIEAVNFARVHGLLISVRGGGHSVSGSAVCDGGLMVDLSRMKGIRVDATRRTARAEAGVLWGELDRETQVFGLATTGGTVSDTGIAGLTLGGGQGWLMAKHGLTCDNLLSVDVVMADGRLLVASATEHPELFWAVRGGGGNFGIVTSFEYQLHPVGPTILGGLMLYPIDQAPDVLCFYREFSQATPDELTAMAVLLNAPDGTPVVAVVVAWLGPLSEGEQHLKPMRTFGTPIVDLVGPTPYVQFQTLLDAAVPRGMQRYLKMGYTPEINDDLIGHVVDHFLRKTSPYSLALFNVIKGAAARIAPEQTPFVHRRNQWHFEILAQWTDPAEEQEHVAWLRAFWHDVERYTQGVGPNFLDADDRVTRVRAAYGKNYERLAMIKNQYDPANLFRLNVNIVPTQ